MTLQRSRKAPQFTLKNGSDRDIALSDFLGKWVILYFYPRDNTSGCTKEAIDFSKLVPRLSKKGTAVVGISPDSSQSHLKFAEKHGLLVELLSDPGHTVCEQYGVWRKKKLYGREYFGVARTTVLIDPKGVVKHIWEKVNVPGHAAEVDTLLDSCRKAP